MVKVGIIDSTGGVCIVIVMVGVLFSTDEGSNVMVVVEVSSVVVKVGIVDSTSGV